MSDIKGLRTAIAASEEAEKRYRGDWDIWNETPVDAEGDRRAFVAGAQFERDRIEAEILPALENWKAAEKAMTIMGDHSAKCLAEGYVGGLELALRGMDR